MQFVKLLKMIVSAPTRIAQILEIQRCGDSFFGIIYPNRPPILHLKII